MSPAAPSEPRARQDARWRDLRLRVASACVLAPAGLACIWSGGAVWAAALALIASAMGAEWVGLCGAAPRSAAGLCVPASLLLSGLVAALASPGLALLALLVLAVGLSLAAGRKALGVGVVYVGLGYMALLALRPGPGGLAQVLFVMLVVWSGDIGAYLAGRLLGGPRLAPRISPGKTWSGSAGGLACSVAAGAAIAWAASGPAPVLPACGLALLLGIASQAGDLLESAIKRHYGRKDSGWIIPGHGGLLDRLDGVLAAAPAAVALSLAVGHALP